MCVCVGGGEYKEDVCPAPINSNQSDSIPSKNDSGRTSSSLAGTYFDKEDNNEDHDDDDDDFPPIIDCTPDDEDIM